MEKIIDLPPNERPREKLAERGPQALSDQELLTVILGSGSKYAGVEKLADQVLEVFSQLNGQTAYSDLRGVRGIGDAKAALLSAAFEFVRRQIRPAGIKIKTPADAYSLLRHLADRKQEHFICISLNGAHEVIATRVVTVGLVNAAHVHPREVFSDPISDRAVSIIVAHNHPSGNVEPSEEDRAVTHRIRDAGEVLGIKLLDHVVFSTGGFFSFKENGGL